MKKSRTSKIKVMIIDDSAVVRQVLQSLLDQEPDIQVIAVASDPIFALDKMRKNWPDVIVLDIEMPRMDGITFLNKIMAEHPTPVVICSSFTEKGAIATMQALAAGAVEIISKPKIGLKDFLLDSSNELANSVRAAMLANIKNLIKAPSITIPVADKLNAEVILSAAGSKTMAKTTERIVAIGASTGGTQALEAVLTALPRVSPGIVVVLHMPEKFTSSYAERLNSLCQIEVREARNNDRVVPGLALIAAGGRHMLLKRSSAYYYVEVKEGAPVNRHCPSVDVLFRSVAKSAGKNATGIILTGMGDDGARGLKEMLDAGAYTLAQDEASCVVFGMPKEAIKLGAAKNILPLSDIPLAILGK
jgi:two-component system chemotaxis response regulator CheB